MSPTGQQNIIFQNSEDNKHLTASFQSGMIETTRIGTPATIENMLEGDITSCGVAV
jgi:hypothetical protein